MLIRNQRVDRSRPPQSLHSFILDKSTLQQNFCLAAVLKVEMLLMLSTSLENSKVGLNSGCLFYCYINFKAATWH